MSVIKNTEELIIDAVLENKTNDEMAEKLNFSTGSIKNHLSKIFKKTKCESKVELAIKMTKLKILKSIEFIFALDLPKEQIFCEIQKMINKEISAKEKDYDLRTSKIRPRMTVHVSEYSKKAARNNGGDDF